MEITLKYSELSKDELSTEDQRLLEAADAARLKAYAPYSEFTVGCALLMEHGQIITGNNQENSAYPSGLCAERVALFHAGAEQLGLIQTLLVVAKTSKNKWADAFPCGGCRQVILEYAMKQQQPIRVLMQLESEKLIELADAKSLLPFAFSAKTL